MKHLLASALLLWPAACALEPPEEEVGELDQQLMSSTSPGWITYSSNSSVANRCAYDPAGDIATGLDPNPDYILAYHSGRSPESTATAPYHDSRAGVVGDLAGNGTLIHRQGIQRINRVHNGVRSNYLLVSGSVKPGTYPGFEIVEMGSQGATQLDFGDAQLGFDDPPDDRDHVVKYQQYSSTSRLHGGGMQVNGSYVVVPFWDHGYPYSPPYIDEPEDVVASFRTFNVSDPPSSTSGPTKFRQAGDMYQAGAAAMTRLSDRHFMVMVFGDDSQDVEVFVSTGETMPTSPGEWIPQGAWPTGFGSSTAYQNLQLVTKCDVPEGLGLAGAPGFLYIVGTELDGDGEDRAVLYRVTFNLYRPIFQYIGEKHFYCSDPLVTDGERYCNFDAGAGIFVDDDGKLILYAVEHYDDGPPDDGTAVKIREFSTY